MEPHDAATGGFPPWVSLEYRHMLSLIGASPAPTTPGTPPSSVLFSSLSASSISTLQKQLEAPLEGGRKAAPFKLSSAPVLEEMALQGVDLSRVCLLDPRAEAEISPSDAGKFDWFLFGGILGDDPPRDRTGELRRLGFPGRRLGPVQLTTDTALAVTKICVEDRVEFDQIPFVDHPTFVFSEHESVEMPFRYVTDEKGEAILPPGMLEHLRQDMDQGFDFDEEE